MVRLGAHMRYLLFALSFVLGMSPIALFAQVPKRPASCSLFDPAGPIDAEAVIASCTQLIESDKLSGKALARAYLTRLMANGQTRTIDHSRIIEDTTKVIEIDPQDGLAYLFRTDSYRATGEFNLALRDANKVIELNPTDLTAFTVRSSLYVAKSEYELAIADATKAVELAPKAPVPYANRAWTYLKAGKTAEALSDINRALSMDYAAPHYYYQRGEIFEAIGRTEEAIADYRNALRLEPNHEGYRQALRRLGAAP